MEEEQTVQFFFLAVVLITSKELAVHYPMMMHLPLTEEVTAAIVLRTLPQQSDRASVILS